MKLFSFKKKKKPNLDAKEAKKKGIGDTKPKRGEDERKAGSERAVAETKTFAVKQSSELAEAIIIRPHITEKGTDIADKDNAYAFEVAPRSTKIQIKQAIRDLYGVTPKKVRVVKISRKRVRDRRGRYGMSGGGKKAYVFLQDGDKIDFV